jgi:catechol 2,3-dioxygenase-like lactoylglutathione lyase family enzyme
MNSQPPALSLGLLVLRAADPAGLAGMYSALGMTFSPEQHGKGPLHYAADCAGTVIEIYPLTPADERTSSTRLGFNVASIHAVHPALEAAGAVLVCPVKSSPWGKRAVFRDPAGHLFELLEKDVRPALSEIP